MMAYVTRARMPTSRSRRTGVTFGSVREAHFMSPPSARVLEGFGAGVPPRPLAGGEGLTWRADDVVLKRVHDERALLFRLVAEQLAHRPRHENDLRPYDRVLGWLGF